MLVKWTVTRRVYQPLGLGYVVVAPLRAGSVLSMLMLLTVVLALLSAKSRAVPVRV